MRNIADFKSFKNAVALRATTIEIVALCYNANSEDPHLPVYPRNLIMTAHSIQRHI